MVFSCIRIGLIYCCYLLLDQELYNTINTNNINSWYITYVLGIDYTIYNVVGKVKTNTCAY